MLSLFKGFRTRTALIYGAFAFFVSSLIRFVPIVGSQYSFFSVADALTPLTGAAGIGMGIFIALMRTGLTFFKISVSGMAPVYHLPGFFASVSWAYPTWFMKIGVPLACMILFVMHPFGFYAAPYVLYWFIPIAVYFSGRNTIFLQALSSTFIAHAVGSVIWLYAKALPTAVWLGLIPVVFFERLFYAVLMTGVYYAVKDLLRILSTTVWFTKMVYVGQKCFSNKNMS